MFLSIIIPVYNVEAYLAECLDSVFEQDLTGCEVITVNDGSTDNSRQILSEYQTKYPELIIVDQENKGLSGARNAGIAHATGDYLYFLDSDDYLLPNAIQNIVQSIKSTNAEVIGFNAMANAETVYITSFKVSDKPKTGIDFFVDFYKDNATYPSVNVPVYIYQRKFLNKNKLKFKEGIYHEDVLFSLLIFYYVQSIVAFNVGVFNYRQHREGSICTNVKLKNLVDRTQICRELNEFFHKQNFSNKYFANRIYYSYLFTINQSVDNNLKKDKRQFFTLEDSKIMRKGVANEYEFKLWLL